MVQHTLLRIRLVRHWEIRCGHLRFAPHHAAKTPALPGIRDPETPCCLSTGPRFFGLRIVLRSIIDNHGSIGISSGGYRVNRFEEHPKKTSAVILLVIFTVIMMGVEWTLSSFHEELGISKSPEKTFARFLRLREWRPNSTKIYRAPKARFNDPNGPVDDAYELRIDAAGFIWPSIIHDKPDAEIVFLGGSTTECLYIRPKMRFPYLVGRQVEQTTNLRINAINAGKSGNHTMHSVLNYLGKVVPRKPQYVVLMHALNDIGILNGLKTYWNERKGIELVQDEKGIGRSGRVSAFMRQVRDSTIPFTYRVVRNGIKAAKERLSAQWNSFNATQQNSAAKPAPQLLMNGSAQAKLNAETEIQRRKSFRESFEPALRSFVRLVKAWRSEPILMTQVLVSRSDAEKASREGAFLAPEALRKGNFDRESFGLMLDYANAIIRHVATSEGVMLIDLSAARQWGNEDVYDGLHFTETGSRRVADVIAGVLSRHITQSPASGRER